MQIPLRERNGDAILVEGVVDHFLGLIPVLDMLCGKHILFDGNIHGAFTEFPEADVDAKTRIHHVPAILVLGLHYLHGLLQHGTHLLYIRSIGHAHQDIEELVRIALGEVGEALAEEGGIEEGHRGGFLGLYLGALVIDVHNLSADSFALNPVAHPEPAGHELDAVDEVVDDILEGQTDTGRETSDGQAQ